MTRNILLSSVCATALLVTGAAWAQDTDGTDGTDVVDDTVVEDEFLGTISLEDTPPPTPAPTPAPPPAPVVAEADVEGAPVTEILLDATLGEETILDAPIAATVVDGTETEIGRQDRLGDAIQNAPNVFFVDQGGPITIRGITSLGISGGVDRQSAVGLFVDGVYIPRPFSYRPFLLDVARVEIARGSQATLLGKNTIGGAVNVIAREPDGTQGGNLSFGIDDSGTVSTEVAFQTPISDNFQARAALSYRKGKGYITNVFDGSSVHDTDDLHGRIIVTGDLATGTRLRFSADVNRDSSDGGLWFAPVADAENLLVDHDFTPGQTSSNGGVSLQLNHDFGGVELTSITAYREHELSFFLDGDFSSADFLGQGQFEDQSQISQEFRLASTGDSAFDWLVGLYFFREDFEAGQSFDLTSFPRDQWSAGTFDQVNTTIAAYGKFDWEFAPRWELSGGLRYTEDKKETRTEVTSTSGTFFFGATGVAEATQTFTNVSPELSLSYAISDEQRVYGRYAQGFKSGGISPFLEADGSANVYEPETTESLELGYRYVSADGRFFFGATAFYTEWEDQQVFISVTPTTRVLRNAAESEAKGIELEGSAQLTENLRLRGAYGYTDATYVDFVDTVLGADFSGNQLVYTPEHTLSFGVDWTQPVSQKTDFVASLDYQFQSGFFFLPDNAFKQGDTHIIDASVGLQGDNWSAKLYVNNLLDERSLKNYFDFGGFDIGVAAPGRTVGVAFTTTF